MGAGAAERRVSTPIAPPYSSARSATMASPRPDPGAASSARTPRLSTSGAALPARRGRRRRRTRGPRRRGSRPSRAPWSAPTCRRCRAGCRASRRGPRAARGRRRRRRRRRGGRQPPFGVQVLERACQGHRRRGDVGRCAGGGPRRGGAGMRQVIVDLPAHALDLLAQHVGTGRVGGAALGLAGNHRQRRLQPVGEVAGAAVGAAHGVGPVIEQGVQVVDERLHFSGKSAADAGVVAGVDPREPRRAAAPAPASARRTCRHRRPGTATRPCRRPAR